MTAESEHEHLEHYHDGGPRHEHDDDVGGVPYGLDDDGRIYADHDSTRVERRTAAGYHVLRPNHMADEGGKVWRVERWGSEGVERGASGYVAGDPLYRLVPVEGVT